MSTAAGDGYGGGASLLSVVFGACSCRGLFDCNQAFDRSGGICLWFSLMVYMFKGLGTIVEQYLQPSMDRVARKFKFSDDVAGATVDAFGASAAEVAASAVCTFVIVNEGGLGVVIGSAVFNAFLVNGIVGYLTAKAVEDQWIVERTCGDYKKRDKIDKAEYSLIKPGDNDREAVLVIDHMTKVRLVKEKHIEVWWYPLLRDSAFYITALCEVLYILQDGEVVWQEGLAMLATYAGYLLYLKFNRKIMKFLGIRDPNEPSSDDGSWHKWGRCPIENHKLEPVVAYELETCDSCGKSIKPREVVCECSECEPAWRMCGRCFEAQRRQEAADRKQRRAEAEVEAELQALSEQAEPGGGQGPASLFGEGYSMAVSATQAAAQEILDTTKEVSASASDRKSEEVRTFVVGSAIKVLSPDSGKKLKCHVLEVDAEQRRVKIDIRLVPEGDGEDGDWIGMDSPAIVDEGKAKSCGCFPSFGTRSNKVAPQSPADCEMGDVDSVVAAKSAVEVAPSEFPGALALMKDPLPLVLMSTMPRPKRWFRLFVLSASVVVFLTYMALDCAFRIGEIVRQPPRVMGMVVVASGLSLSDALGSVEVARSREGGDRFTNSLGLPIFDLLIGVGVPWMIRGLMGKTVSFVAQQSVLQTDLFIVLGLTVLFLLTLAVNNFVVTRRVSQVLMLFHAVFVAFMLVTGPGSIPANA